MDGVILLHCRRKDQSSDLECEIHSATIKKPNKYEFKVACPYQNAYDKVKVITFDKSRAQFLPKSLFNVLRHVEYASLARIELEHIHPAAFHYARDLLEIDMSHNLLEQIASKEFYGANNLRKLNLSYNQLSYIDPDAFVGLENLRVLSLIGNMITKFRAPVFTTYLPRLEHLDLSENSITESVASIICSNQTLLSLNLTANALNHLPTCTSSMINQFVLRDNRISEINVNKITVINNLRSLDVSDNAIKHINLHSSGHDIRLLTLNLSHCLIDKISKENFVAVQHIQVLDISYNRLNHIPHDSFDLLKNLRELYIDGNILRQIDFEAMRNGLPGLELLSIADNFWTCDYLNNILEIFCNTNVKLLYSRGRSCIDQNGNDVTIPIDDDERPQDDRRVAASEQLWFYVLLLFGIILSASLGYTALKKYCLNQLKYY